MSLHWTRALQMKREALEKINRPVSEAKDLITSNRNEQGFDTVLGLRVVFRMDVEGGSSLESIEQHMSGRSAAW
jgi:hypothetical protein